MPSTNEGNPPGVVRVPRGTKGDSVLSPSDKMRTFGEPVRGVPTPSYDPMVAGSGITNLGAAPGIVRVGMGTRGGAGGGPRDKGTPGIEANPAAPGVVTVPKSKIVKIVALMFSKIKPIYKTEIEQSSNLQELICMKDFLQSPVVNKFLAAEDALREKSITIGIELGPEILKIIKE